MIYEKYQNKQQKREKKVKFSDIEIYPSPEVPLCRIKADGN